MLGLCCLLRDVCCVLLVNGRFVCWCVVDGCCTLFALYCVACG